MDEWCEENGSKKKVKLLVVQDFDSWLLWLYAFIQQSQWRKRNEFSNFTFNQNCSTNTHNGDIYCRRDTFVICLMQITLYLIWALKIADQIFFMEYEINCSYIDPKILFELKK